MGHVYIFFADGFEDIEGLAVVDLFRRAEIDIQTVSIKDTREVTTSHGVELKTDRIFAETDFSDAEVLILPGGMPGTRYLGEYQPLTDLLKSFYNKGGRIAAICAAPSVFVQLGFLKGRKATSYPSFQTALEEAGADYTTEVVAVDGNVTTSRGFGTAIDFGLALIAQLKGQEKAEEISKSIVYHR
ncbi:MAG: DJ-1/PfpI family protein [Blautia sp.]|nr:DJ-1/PfpI family protein [Blautia sp.]